MSKFKIAIVVLLSLKIILDFCHYVDFENFVKLCFKNKR